MLEADALRAHLDRAGIDADGFGKAAHAGHEDQFVVAHQAQRQRHRSALCVEFQHEAGEAVVGHVELVGRGPGRRAGQPVATDDEVFERVDQHDVGVRGQRDGSLGAERRVAGALLGVRLRGFDAQVEEPGLLGADHAVGTIGQPLQHRQQGLAAGRARMVEHRGQHRLGHVGAARLQAQVVRHHACLFERVQACKGHGQHAVGGSFGALRGDTLQGCHHGVTSQLEPQHRGREARDQDLGVSDCSHGHLRPGKGGMVSRAHRPSGHQPV